MCFIWLIQSLSSSKSKPTKELILWQRSMDVWGYLWVILGYRRMVHSIGQNKIATRQAPRLLCYPWRILASIESAFIDRSSSRQRFVCNNFKLAGRYDRILRRCGLRWRDNTGEVSYSAFISTIAPRPPPVSLRALHLRLFRSSYLH